MNAMLLQRQAMDKHGMVVTMDVKGKILSANEKCSELSGFAEHEIVGKYITAFAITNISNSDISAIFSALALGNIWQGEVHSLRKTGEPWFVFATVVPVVKKAPLVDHLIVIATDISQQKRLEKSLSEGRAFYRSITDSIGEGVYAVNAEGKTQFLNPAASRLLGWTLEELQDRRFHDTVHYQKGDGTLLKREQCPVNLTIRDGKSYTSYEDFFTDKRGRLFPISIVAVPLLNNEGKPDGHVGVFNDISSQKAIEHKLQKAYDEAQGANKAKTDFLATMSHEIRTPMNAIIGLTHLALETQDNDQRQQYLEKVQKSSNALLELMNSILDFSKVEANKIDILDEPFTLTKTIDKLAQVFQVKAQQKQLQLLFDIRCSTKIRCSGDSEKIYQVLLNLLSNAIKFTETGHVLLKIDKRGNELGFSVSDTGMGISDTGKTKLFNAFEQADASISRKFGGTGLGLAICKRLVELMGGELTIESKVNEGTNFAFSLPICIEDTEPSDSLLPVSIPSEVLCIQTHKSVEQGCQILCQTLQRFNIHCLIADPNENLLPKQADFSIVFLPVDESSWKSFLRHVQFGEYHELNCNVLISPFSKEEVQKRIGTSLSKNIRIIELPFTEGELISTLSPLHASTNKKTSEGLESKKWRTKRLLNKRVLVVDDDLISVEISQQILKDLGVNVVTAMTGELALALCKSNTFDAILLDCHLPGITGYDIAETLTHKEGCYTPIIALSADETNEASEKALSAGMCHHLVKPATADEIVHTIDIHIHAGYMEITPPSETDAFIASLLSFYDTYSQRSVMSNLLNIFHEPTHTSQLLTELLADAQRIGATTLERCLHRFMEAKQRPDTINAKHISDISFELDATLRLIAHTIDKSEVGNECNEASDVDNTSLRSSLEEVKNALEAYDAKALELITALAARHFGLGHSHTLNQLKKLASIYDFEGALVVAQSLIDEINNDRTE
ncbi:PAS domain-containing hybrid sensor histidine kinase/response regulator [Alteromonas mediterranea]|uniref:histidine kinase n=1 Tax=Alteromonas mediterranea TaxID=314275 RepID=A0AAC8XHZ5_9ALTE|nr:PAS domain-containing hybrid sensor histidine kinase/response regulator [Alteromonas mediterranea]AFV84249.1 PAS signal transduction protein [Alteromonas mediterranea DE1]AGP96257.1 PAS signal transduction protein [Alteromonas mediterranea UM7]AGQ00591.1 PAS signal transduction protein [Alteromonas mediterranea UM4b]AMJ77446.1 hybrid sensor histidine kinase/response regulator [Alteromonas mediterranea]AMJ81598.1 hybrid sensor histidine kinase/response regulator [Alteromonas mediterranea]